MVSDFSNFAYNIQNILELVFRYTFLSVESFQLWINQTTQTFGIGNQVLFPY